MLSATFFVLFLFCYCFTSKLLNFGWHLMCLYVTSAGFHFSIIEEQRYLLKKQVQVCEQVCKFTPLCKSRFTRSKFPFKSKASASSAVCSLAFVSILLVNSQLKCTVKLFAQAGFACLKICQNCR